MSAHFSPADLYRVVVENDTEGLKKGILYLGAKIIDFPVWSGQTAIVYAARLGHIQQVKLLFHELERYYDFALSFKNEIVRDTFKEIVQHWTLCDLEFFNKLCGIVERVHLKFEGSKSCMYWRKPIDYILSAGHGANRVDSALLDFLIDRDDFDTKVVEAIVEYCFQKSWRLLLEWVRLREDRPFTSEVQKFKERDPLRFAMVNGDTDDVESILARVPRGGNGRWSGNVQSCPLFSEVPYSCGYDPPVELTDFSTLLIRTGDERLFRTVINSNMWYLERISGQSVPLIMEEFWKIALDLQACNIITLIIADEKFDKSEIKWHDLYIRLLMSVKLEAAAAIEHMRGVLDESTIDRLNRRDTSNFLNGLPSKLPEKVLNDLVEKLEYATISVPHLWKDIKTAVCEFPRKHGRPEMVASFQKYGIDYTDVDVMNAHAKKGKSSNVEMGLLESNWDCEAPCAVVHGDDIESPLCGVILGGCVEPISAFTDSRLVRECKHTHMTKPWCKCDEFRSLLKRCILETGRRLKMEYDARWSARVEAYLNEVEKERRAALTLQKLCRGAVRLAVRTANPDKSLMDGLMSLYIGDLLPEPLVRYLQFRDGSSGQALYYRLIPCELDHGVEGIGEFELSPYVSEDEIYMQWPYLYYSSDDSDFGIF